MSDNNKIYFIVEESVTEEVVVTEGERSSTDTGGGWNSQPHRSRVDAITHRIQQQRVGIKANVLKTQIQDMIGVVNEIFTEDPQSLAGQDRNDLRLEEITLSVQVNAKGELSILGTGGEIGGSGGIALKFTKPKS